MNISGGICLAFFIILLCQHTSADTLTITKIRCRIPTASGLEFLPNLSAEDLRTLITRINIISGIAVGVLAVGAAAPIAIVAAVGVGAGTLGSMDLNSAISDYEDFIDEHLSDLTGSDDLYVTIDGERVWPTGDDTFREIEANGEFDVNIKYRFQGDFEVKFWDEDTFTDDTLAAEFGCGNCEEQDVSRAIVMNPSENSVYEIAYTIEKDSQGGEEQWKICGTERCIDCDRPNCPNSDGGDLDRDKDVEDLRNCPAGFRNEGTKLFEDSVPLFGTDQFLRICSKNAS